MVKIILFLTIFISEFSFSAGFDCAKSDRKLESVICSDKKLSKLDEDMSLYYFEIRKSLDTNESELFLKKQRSWLKRRIEECNSGDTNCLVKLYEIRILELWGEYEHLIAYPFPKNYMFQIIDAACSFDSEVISENTVIYAGGSYSGKRIKFDIDDSGRQATQFEVIVNSPDKPVALFLGSHEASIWNITWTKGTEISAVLATGYNKQTIAGLPKKIPRLISTYRNDGRCGSIMISKNDFREIDPLSRRVFNKNVTSVQYAKKGHLIFGNQPSRSDKLYTSKETPPESFFVKSRLGIAGEGLQRLVKNGFIRKTTIQDTEEWLEMKSQVHSDELSPVSAVYSSEKFKLGKIRNGYIILKAITFPYGLYGSSSATFFLKQGVPYPEGNLGHSTLYDLGTMTCTGPDCVSNDPYHYGL